MEENKPNYRRLENNLEQEDNPTEEDLKRWEKKWKKFHKSLPDKMVFRDYQKTLQLIDLAKHRTPPGYYAAIRKYRNTLDEMQRFGNRAECQIALRLLLDLDLESLGRYKDSFSPDAGQSFRRALAERMNSLPEPYSRIESLIRHCCYEPSQRKIEDGAEVLANTSALYNFVKDFDRPLEGEVAFADRVWLYSLAFSWESNHPDRDKFIEILCIWLSYADCSVREFAAHALGSLKATQARTAIESALSGEKNSATREALKVAIANISSG